MGRRGRLGPNMYFGKGPLATVDIDDELPDGWDGKRGSISVTEHMRANGLRRCPCCTRVRRYDEFVVGTRRHRICEDCDQKRVDGTYLHCADCGWMPVHMFDFSTKGTLTGYQSRCVACTEKHRAQMRPKEVAARVKARVVRRADDLEAVRRVEEKQRARGEAPTESVGWRVA